MTIWLKEWDKILVLMNFELNLTVGLGKCDQSNILGTLVQWNVHKALDLNPKSNRGLEDCGEILVLVKYDNNQTVRLWEMSSQSLQYSVKIGEYLIKVGEPSKLGLWPLDRITLGWVWRFWVGFYSILLKSSLVLMHASLRRFWVWRFWV